VSDEGGVVVETQAVPGSGFERIRVRCGTRASPRAFFLTLWSTASDLAFSPLVVRRDVLLDEPQVRRYHDVVHAPPAGDRDYVAHETWSEDEATHVVSMRFEAVDDPRSPVTAELVRFPRLEGSMTLRPRADGGSVVTYEVYTELGGSLPAWLTRGPQRDAARTFVLEIRKRAEQTVAR
jgi:hypothetical protein